MTNSMSDQRPSSQLARIAPLLRGLLANKTDNPDMPYQPVILKSLTTKEAIAFTASDENEDV
ncbi:MAG: hypothetical protein ACYS76_13835, partial [Planctomycetota bacterium]